MKRSLILLSFAILAFNFRAGAQTVIPGLELPSIISDHAVLQKNTNVKLWGWFYCKMELRIVCSWNPSDTVVVHSDNHRYWSAYVKTPEAGGPYTIKFMDSDNDPRGEVKDIMIGETWLCAGQSNMEYNYRLPIDDIKDKKEFARKNNKIRVFKVPARISIYPMEKLEGKWEICDPETVNDFSTIGFCFGKRLNKDLGDVPVGLIGSYWGGSPIEPWMESRMLEYEKLQKISNSGTCQWSPSRPSCMYNAMIHPITDYNIAGVIWYQGESNVGNAPDYATLFDNMIRGWRNAFHKYLPFYFVQIAPLDGYQEYPEKYGALLREKQTEVAGNLENTGMVLVSDLVSDIKNIHPTLKRQAADRLANLVLKEVYHHDGLKPYYPKYKSLRIKGDKVYVSVTSLDKLSLRGEKINNFEIVGEDGKLHPAEAKVMRNGEICVWSKNVKQPTAVRYCFSNGAMPNLFDSNGLPLAPFRTDKTSK